MPNAGVEEREAARDNLHKLAQVLMRIEDRVAREWYAQEIRKDGEGAIK